MSPPGSTPAAPAAPDSAWRIAGAHALGGVVGGVVSRTLTAPFDRLRTLMQAASGVPLRPPAQPGRARKAYKQELQHFRLTQKGALRHAFAHVREDGGWRGFFRGNGANCLKIAPDAAVQFAVNSLVTRRLAGGDSRRASLSQRIMAGAVAGAVSNAFIYPLDLVKTRITVAGRGEYAGIMDCVAKTAAAPSKPGQWWPTRFYRGFFISQAGVIPYMGTKLGLYTFICDQVRERTGRRIGTAADQVASCCCSLAGITVAYPMNLARTKMQTQGVNGREQLYDNGRDCIRKTVHYEGWRGLFRGFLPNAMKALPAQAMLLQVQRRVSDSFL
eukprot:TRINITY_DN23560_c0_g1_i1.p1 TRINITY_DN23560_c0_g1~~TRINITY_DN23560_c0_g1_i1.p1  ORF type:complete len:330 (+),score=58.96 TRINITY_DN23560_c0_g1_i1:93-1082(+)